jgi:hypothetical protein
MLVEVHQGIHYLQYDIKVNGSKGLEPILKDTHNGLAKTHEKLERLEGRTMFLEKVTAKARSSFELYNAMEKWSGQRKWVGVLFKTIFNKVVAKIAVVLVAILITALLGDRAVSLVARFIHSLL